MNAAESIPTSTDVQGPNPMEYSWARHYDPGVPLEVELPQGTVPGLLLEVTARSPGSEALVFFGKTVTYQDLQDQVRRLARAFRNLGLGPGERLAILLPNCPQMVTAYHAVLSLGSVAVLLNPLLSPPEIAYKFNDSGSRMLVVLDHFLPRVEEVADEVHLEQVVVTSLPEALPWPLSWLYPFKARYQGLASGFTPGPGRHRREEHLDIP